MNRTEPPRPATWMLEHLTPADRDEALAGDLLESFRAGRSSAWYWRQVLAAWFVGWLKYLSMRRSLLIFAALWSTLAPAWATIVDRIDRLDSAMTIGPLFRTFCLWVALNTAFIWTGMLLFIMVHSLLASSFSGAKLRRAFMLAPLIFLPVYFATFVTMNLFAYPGFVIGQAVRTPLGEIADWKMRADALRIPYLLTILWTMWRATPLMGALKLTSITRRPVKPQVQAGIPAANAVPKPGLDAYTAKRFMVFMIGAGLLNGLIAGFLLCRLPESHTPTLNSLVGRAVIYVAIGALAGTAGIYLYWNSPSSPFRAAAPLPFSLFALTSAAGWVWVPAMVILSEQLTPATALVVMIGAFVLASGLRRATYFVFAPAHPVSSTFDFEHAELFEESLYRPPVETHGYVIAISLYAAGVALRTHSIYTASAFLAFGASLFAWKRTVPLSPSFVCGDEVKQAAGRLARVAIPAVLVTIWALLYGVSHRAQVEQENAALAAGNSADSDANRKPSTRSAHGFGGYESLILWPYPEKKQIVPPIPREDWMLAERSSRPAIIRFDGSYWYVQPPDKRPGPLAHQAHGTPIGVDIHANNGFPIVMDAHQPLAAPIRIAHLREIEVEIENRDNRTGLISLAILLTDGTSPQKRTLYLGQQPIASTESTHFSIKPVPVFETLRFSVPANGSIRKFDDITVLVLPDIEHMFTPPRIAIMQFQLDPR